MTREELEEKIKNNESVYFVTFRNEIVKIDRKTYYENCGDIINCIDLVFSSKDKAKHFLQNSNVTRLEKLPYVTWEELEEQEYKLGSFLFDMDFTTKDYRLVRMCIQDHTIFIDIIHYDCDMNYEKMFEEPLTEENFYKAYDVCRKLFLGEKI